MESSDYSNRKEQIFLANYESDKEYYPDNFIHIYRPTADLIADGIMACVPPALMVLGCIGNILIIAVMKNWKNNHLHYSQFLAILAAVDTVLLVAKLGNDWVAYMWNVNVRVSIRNRSEVACQLLPLGLGKLR